MQSVSAEWKDNHEQTILGESFVEVSLDITDPDVIADASSQDNGASHFSDTAQVVSEVDRDITPHATLEQNLWILNGSLKTLPSTDYGDCGFVGDVLCNESGTFSDKTPIVTINFSEVHLNPIPAITITWSKAYGEFAKNFIVTVYNGDTIVATQQVTSNKSVTSVVMMDISNFDRITISVLRWCLPHRRARIEEIFVGLRKVFNKSNMFNYSHTQTVDPISSSLPKAEVVFSVDNTDNAYNPYNNEGLSKYLMERQEIRTRYGYKLGNNTEWIKGGNYYLSKWNAKQNGISAEFTARDLLEFLYTDYSENTDSLTIVILSGLAERILESANLPLNKDGSKKWYIDGSIRAVSIIAPIPIDTRANYLLMIANATNCVLYTDRNGVLRLEPLEVAADPDYAITQFNSYSKPEITLSKSIKEIAVKVHKYSMGEDGIVDTTEEVIIPISASGERMVIDNPLITDSSRARSVGEWTANVLKNRATLDVSWRPDVRLDALDTIKVTNSFNDNRVIMTDINYKFNGAFRATGKGRVI